MKIFLNTRGLSVDNDYRWFSLNHENSLSDSPNHWKNPIISRIPNFEEFGLVFGRGIEENEQSFFLLVANLETSRLDVKERKIRNTFILQSKNETLLKKIAYFLFQEHENLEKQIDKFIVFDEKNKHELAYNYEKIKEVFTHESDKEIKNLLYVNEVEPSKYLRVSRLTDENSEEITENLKELFFYEKSPLNSIIFVYLPYINFQEISEKNFYATISREFDKKGESETSKDIEEWALIQKEKEKSFLKNKFKNVKFQKALTCLFVIVVSIVTYNYYFDVSSLEKKVSEFEAKNIRLQVERQNLSESLKAKIQESEISKVQIFELEKSNRELKKNKKFLEEKVQKLEFHNKELQATFQELKSKDLKELRRLNKAYLNRIYSLKWERNKYRNQLNKLQKQ